MLNRFTVLDGFLIELKCRNHCCVLHGGRMRFNKLFLFLVVCVSLTMPLALTAHAAAKPSTPDNLEPLPEALPPPGAIEGDVAEEPQVTIVKKGEDTVEEYRVHGELYMQKITPAHGVPYYLMKEDQGGDWSRFDGVSRPLAIPKWVIFRF